MLTNYRDGWHEKYTETPRHWCPRSETYTGADSLLTALDEGWEIMTDAVYREVIMINRSRHTTIFYFNLYRGSHTRTMAVVANPFVQRFLRSNHFRVRAYQDATSTQEIHAQSALQAATV